MFNMWVFSIGLALVLCALFGSTFGALSDDADMLKAASKGELDRVREFIRKKGVSITTKNNNGVSAIIFAANNGHKAVVEELLSFGANIEDKSNNWKTPLLWASLWGHMDVVQFLVEKGANVSARDIYGLTPVMSACMSGNVNVVQYLIDQGSPVTETNHYNGTALTIARSRKDDHMVKVLLPYFPNDDEGKSPYQILAEILLEKLRLYFSIFLSEVFAVFGVSTESSGKGSSSTVSEL